MQSISARVGDRDVSALSPLDILFAITAGHEQEPAIMSEACGETPPGAAYALLERFCQLFEAKHGRPFEPMVASQPAAAP